jgi:hypothetical protein
MLLITESKKPGEMGGAWRGQFGVPLPSDISPRTLTCTHAAACDGRDVLVLTKMAELKELSLAGNPCCDDIE